MTDTMETVDVDLGRRFAEALGEKDFAAVEGLLAPEIDFRGLTPGRQWEANSPRAVVDDILRQWFEDSDAIERVAAVQTDVVADRGRVGYRFEGTNPDGAFVVEQQAYFGERDGRIAWMRIVCSGFRPR